MTHVCLRNDVGMLDPKISRRNERKDSSILSWTDWMWKSNLSILQLFDSAAVELLGLYDNRGKFFLIWLIYCSLTIVHVFYKTQLKKIQFDC